MPYRLLPEREAAARVVLETVGLQLAPEFEEALFDAAREKIVYGGWRAGKSSLGASEVMLDIILRLTEGKSALYWIIGPDYAQTIQEYNYLATWAGNLGMVVSNSAPLEGPRRLELKGGFLVETKSAQYTERLGSVAPDLIIACEAGQLSDEVRIWLHGRAMEKRARIIYTGTLEDENSHPAWAWYTELGSQWLEDRDKEHSAYSLPSWANRVVFPGGRNDPEITRQEREWREYTGADYTFLRRIAGVPAGSPYQVYPQLDTAQLLRARGSLPSVRAVGGIDWGTQHSSALVVVTESDNGIAWVRECVVDDAPMDKGNPDWVRREHSRLKKQWRAYEWGADPNEKFMARSYDATAVSGSIGSREARIGLVTARLNRGALFFDLNGSGVQSLYQEMRKVHRQKQKSGEITLVRRDDDRTAALEDAIEVLDGHRKKDISSFKAVRPKPVFRRKEFVGI